jgi:hypothetical protein
MRGIEERGFGEEGAEREGECTYCEGRGVGAGGSMMEITREERCERERDTGRELWATIMRSLPCWETGWTMMRRGGAGVSSSSCSTFTVEGEGYFFWDLGLGFGMLGGGGVWRDALLTRHIVGILRGLDGKVLAVEA